MESHDDPDAVEKRLQLLTQAETTALEARHRASPDSLSSEEHSLLLGLQFRRTRALLDRIKQRAQGDRGPGDVP